MTFKITCIFCRYGKVSETVINTVELQALNVLMLFTDSILRKPQTMSEIISECEDRLDNSEM